MTTPFTPRPSSRSSHLGLSTKQYSKVAHTLASVRRNRQYKSSQHDPHDPSDEEEEPRHQPAQSSRANGGHRDSQKAVTERLPTRPADPRPPLINEHPSFLAEASFVAAPLNSRVPSRPAPSPGYTSKGKGKERPHVSIQGVAIELQEALVLEDLLFILMGVGGTYITVDPSYDPEEAPEGEGVKFCVSDGVDPSLRDLAERIIPLANYYTAISAFVELRSPLENGLVNHALCAAIRDMLQDYLTLVSQLEHLFNTSPSFTLQKLWFYVQPTLHTLSLIHSLTSELLHADKDNDAGLDDDDDDEDEIDARDAALGLTGLKNGKLKDEILEEGGIIRGGEVVTVLWERMHNMSGDPTAHELYRSLFRKASIPYVTMLRKWTTTGHLKDPYNELLVKEQKTQLPDVDFIDEYWERRYTLRDGTTLNTGPARRTAGVPKPRSSGRLPGGACIPPLLDAWKHKILLAGKYLNVIRECGRGFSDLQDQLQSAFGQVDEDLALDDERFYKGVEDAYTVANKSLLRLLIDDQQLIPRLRSLKFYYFLSRSAFISGFFTNARKELSRPSKSASAQRLQSLFDLSISTSEEAPTEVIGFGSDVKLKLETSTLWNFLTKVDGITGIPVGLGGTTGDEFLGGLGTLSATSSALLNGAGDDRKVHRSSKDKNTDKDADKDKSKEILTAMDALTLDYKVKFPLSLVMSRKYILRYQLIFRFLVQLKSAEQDLLEVWMDHKGHPWATKLRPSTRSTTPVARGAARSTTPVSRPSSAVPPPQSPTDLAFAELDRWRMRVIILRSRMLSFVQNILYFATFEVIEPRWRELEVKLGKVTTVDQLLKDHLDFLDTCLKGCMLTSAKSVRALSTVLSTCHRYLRYSGKMTQEIAANLAALERGDVEGGGRGMKHPWEFLSKFEINFNHHIKVYTDNCQFSASSENTALLALVVRLNAVRASAGPDA